MNTPDVNEWFADIKAQARSDEIGMMLVHRGVVRGTSRSGEPVAGMKLSTDHRRLEEVLAEARAWQGVVAIRAWVNEGRLSVGDDIMAVLVAGDIRENVFGALQRLVTLIKTEVVSESEIPSS
jgi:molybdopterin synthase catalytic subunit